MRTGNKHSALRIILLVLLSSVILLIPNPLPSTIGTTDLRPYWSSTYLLAHGEDFSDAERLDEIERTLAGWDKHYTMYAWFAPTGNLVLLPYTLFSFSRAAFYWLLTNIVVVFLSGMLLWRLKNTHQWVPLVAVFGFSFTLTSLFYGQVNTLVLFGLALYLHFRQKGQDTAAGASLLLTTIKPHLVIFALPLLLLDALRSKRWRILAGFGVAGLAAALILFAFNPRWPTSFWSLVSLGMESARETPTLAGLLVIAGQYALAKWLWLAVAALAAALWWKYGENREPRGLINAAIFAGMAFAPLGWSYDQIMLLLPVLSLLEWVVGKAVPRSTVIGVISALLAVDIASIVQRRYPISDVWYFWVPLAIAAIYIFGWQQKKKSAGSDQPNLEF